ncbi:hypothetical protein NVS89_00570 [Ancylobacter sp. MQZ15Z-1]|uniref:Uncharacterized protein n=1 Tax=Ancylobacter mangrovi TaxID=2972472 RepID=A0A9X2P7T5_9HYPH|nr:hypothetical protein [Ancylobacter mangrovi]MCS0493571.1 hypothetical protein [Ancylobacter mangrovi]
MRSLFRDILPLAVAGGLIAVAVIAPLRAEEAHKVAEAGLQPGAAQKIELGYVTGIAYYVAQNDGYHVVATLSAANGAPVRVAATLQPEQVVSFSVPGASDGVTRTVEIARRGDAVLVTNPARLVLN